MTENVIKYQNKHLVTGRSINTWYRYFIKLKIIRNLGIRKGYNINIFSNFNSLLLSGLPLQYPTELIFLSFFF